MLPRYLTFWSDLPGLVGTTTRLCAVTTWEGGLSAKWKLRTRPRPCPITRVGLSGFAWLSYYRGGTLNAPRQICMLVCVSFGLECDCWRFIMWWGIEWERQRGSCSSTLEDLMKILGNDVFAMLNCVVLGGT